MVMPAATRLAALALDRLAMARIEAGKEIVEGRKTLVVPVKLLVGALQEAVLGEKFPFGFAREGHMHRRGLADAAQRDEAACERRADLLAIDVVADQEARAGRRRERNRALQLRIIAAAGALIGIGPAAVEHVFALRMRFQIAGHDADDPVRRSSQSGAAVPSRCAAMAEPDSSTAEKKAWETKGL